MKKLSRALIATSLAAALTISTAAPALAACIGDDLHVSATELNNNTTLSQGVYWGYTAADKRVDNYITYAPNGAVTPIVTYGNYVTQTSTVSTAARALEAAGYRVVAGTNGGYYDTSNGVPIGLLMTRGSVVSADALYYAAGFKADGSVVIGKPSVWMSLDLGLGDGVSRSVVALNKTRGNYGIYMYTANFNAASTTGTTSDGVDVVLSLDSGAITLGSPVTMTVESVTDHTSGTKVASGKVVLTANYQSAAAYTDALKALTVGSTVTLNITTADSAWSDVQYAIGSAYPLVLDGTICSGLSATANPYTAIGVKSDGTVVLYTIDGRQSGYSVGATQALLAQRMQELGCVNAICLDGGGSTAMSVTSPDSTTAALITSPSGGSERAITNQIFFVASNQSTDDPLYCYVSPENNYALAGADIKVHSSVVDTAYIPMGKNVSFSISGGGDITDEGVFTAPAQYGTSVITASSGSVSGTAEITTVVTPDNILVNNGKSNVSSLTVRKTASVALNASAIYKHLTIASANYCYNWAVTGNIGTITPEGVFTATDSGKGTIEVSAGEKTVSIPVTVAPTLLNSSCDGVLIDSAMLSTDCTTKLGTVLDRVTFTQPDASAGALYYQYKSSNKSTSAVSADTSFYVSADPFIGDVKFVPAAGFSGNIDIPYTGYDASGASYTGTITVVVESKTSSATFTDVGGDAGYSWAANSVDFLYAYGITNGQSATVFGAAKQISRGDFMLMLCRAFDLGSLEGASSAENFPDVKPSSYYAEAIAIAKSLGIAKGSDGSFLPASPITRQDAMVLMTRTMSAVGMTVAEPDAEALSAFTDAASVSSYASDAVSSLVSMGIVNGSKGAINPKSGITRAEMACIIHRVLANPF